MPKIHSKIGLELHTNSTCRTLGSINCMVIYFALFYILFVMTTTKFGQPPPSDINTDQSLTGREKGE